MNNIFIGVVAILVGLIILVLGAVIDDAPAIPTLLLIALVFALGVFFGVKNDD
jgi:hypothetical protein